MPPPPHVKPENVLKRAQELIAVGQSSAALTVLHEHVTSKRSRNSPIASLEPVMILFVELSVDLRKGKSAKDGLYQYKNIAQNTNVGTIELVLKKFIDLAEEKVAEAQKKAAEVQSSLETSADGSEEVANNNKIEDLEATETPETILLATVSGEQSKDRTDRAIVTPWLKFLWETYRTVLEILKNNARLEVMYQSTALQAFQFCLKHTRKTEFRRLCELLRNHVQNAAKYSSQMHAINLSDPDTLQRHLDTRFQQLNVAVELELWQEAFRSVEDIHMLLTLSKRPAKNIMMAGYYEKLARIFLVSDNFLFHAAAYSRYYNLLRQSANAVATGQSPKKDNPQVTEAEMTKAASFVVLSALAIPVISTSRSRGALIDVDEVRKNKNSRLTNLLSMSSSPSRTGLFKDAISKGLLKRVRPEIRDLYNILEVDFHPLSICKKISPILAQIGADAEMEKYVLPLQQVILTRLFQQLSQVYESVDLKFVYELAQFPSPFEVTPSMIEKFIMNGCKKGDLAIRLDHVSGVLTFDNDVFSSAKALHAGSAAGSAEQDIGSVQRLQNTPSEIARAQLSRLAKCLHVTCQYVDPSFNQARRAAKEVAFANAASGAEAEHADILARRAIIEKKKEAATEALQRKQREEETRKRMKTQQAVEAERQRLVDETREREKRRMREEQDRIRRAEVEKQLEELKGGIKGIDLKDIDIDELDSSRIRALKLSALEKEKNELNDRVAATGKRIDHLERAFRREEVKHLPEDYDKQRAEDTAIYEEQKEATLSEAQIKHKEGVALKRRLERLIPQYDAFRKDVSERRHEEFEKRRKAAERDFENKKRQRVQEVRETRHRERMAREAEERRIREEEEQAARDAEEKAAKEEQRREALAKRKAEAEAERAKLDEVARKQREREEEAAARRAASKTAPPAREAPVRGAAPPSSEERTAPRLPFVAKGGGWRERQAAKEAGGAVDSPAAPEGARKPSVSPAPTPAAEEAPKRSGYVPPHLRGDRPARPEAPPAEESRAPRRESEAPRREFDAPRRELDAPKREFDAPRRDQTASPAAEGAPPASRPAAGGKWVPPHLRNRG